MTPEVVIPYTSSQSETFLVFHAFLSVNIYAKLILHFEMDRNPDCKLKCQNERMVSASVVSRRKTQCASFSILMFS